MRHSFHHLFLSEVGHLAGNGCPVTDHCPSYGLAGCSVGEGLHSYSAGLSAGCFDEAGSGSEGTDYSGCVAEYCSVVDDSGCCGSADGYHGADAG